MRNKTTQSIPPLLRGRHLIHPKYRTHSENISCLVDLTEYHNLRKDGNTSLTLHSYTGSVEFFLYFPIIISNLKSTYTFLPYNEGVIILKKKKKKENTCSLRLAR